jgi:hypothetical protein
MTPEDWACLAHIVTRTTNFKEVIGVPSGGLAFAEALKPYCTPDAHYTLIVDDVLTTGGSMQEAARNVEGPVGGIVVFSRTPLVPNWIFPIWTFNPVFFAQ